jgi:hypothetical protein
MLRVRERRFGRPYADDPRPMSTVFRNTYSISVLCAEPSGKLNVVPKGLGGREG